MPKKVVGEKGPNIPPTAHKNHNHWLVLFLHNWSLLYTVTCRLNTHFWAKSFLIIKLKMCKSDDSWKSNAVQKWYSELIWHLFKSCIKYKQLNFSKYMFVNIQFLSNIFIACKTIGLYDVLSIFLKTKFSWATKLICLHLIKI